MTATQPLISTAQGFSGGADAVAPFEEDYSVTFGGVWVSGEDWTLEITDSLSGLQTQIGAGFVSGILPTFCLTYDNGVYVLAGSTVYISAIGLPQVWNDPNQSGNGFIELTNWYYTPEPLLAMSAYQGGLAFFSRNSVQIWNTDANLANWGIRQQLPNIGTNAPQSVQSLGDLDIIFLSDTGFRSLRARDITLNAFINDIGSPIDPIIQNAILSGNFGSANSAVEPTSGRYMCFLNGVIYVLSYYPSNKILAWSTYTPRDNLGQVFKPQFMKVYQGQVVLYGLDHNGVPATWQFGGPGNVSYDKTQAKWQTGFFDAKTPGTNKNAKGVSIGVNGGQGGIALENPDSWNVYASMHEYTATDPTIQHDPQRSGFTLVGNRLFKSNFDQGITPYSDTGTHISIYGMSNGDGGGVGNPGGPATFNIIIVHEFPGNEEG